MTFIPIPSITKSVISCSALSSVRIPHIFLGPTRISFGHFISQARPVIFLRVSATLTAAMSVNFETSVGARPGLNMRERYIPPLGEDQLRPILPLPLACLSARTAAPSSAPSSAIR